MAGSIFGRNSGGDGASEGNRRLSYKQMVCLSLFAVAAVLLCSFGAYAWSSFEKECRNVALRETANTSRMVVSQVDERLNNLGLYYISKATEDDVQYVIENDIDYSDYLHIKDAQDAFACKTYMDDYVNAYAFVNYRTEWVISSKGMFRLDEVTNSEVLDYYFVDGEEYRNKYYWAYDESDEITNKVNKLYRTTIETAGLNYVMRLPYGYNPYVLLIVNVNQRTWERWIEQQLAEGEEIVVLDGEGDLIYASVPDLADEILEMGGVFNREIEVSGTKYMTAASSSGILGWQYCVLHDIALEKNDFSFSLIWVLIILLLTLLVFAMAAYLIYQPVGNLVRDISTQSKLPEGKRKMNEIDFLSGSINMLRRDNHSLQTAVDKSRDKLLELFELRLVRGEVRREDEWREYVDNFGLRSWKYFAAVVVVLDLSDAEEDQSSVGEDVICLRLVEDMPDEIKSLAWMPPIYNACTIFAILAEENEYQLFERIESYYSELQEYVRQASGYRILMGVSTNHTEHKHIQAAYRESIMALTVSANKLDDRRDNALQRENCRFYLNSSTVTSGIGYNDRFEREIQTAIKAMDKPQCYKVTDDLCRHLSQSSIAQHESMIYVLRYVNAILVTAMEAKIDLTALYPQGLRKLYAEILEVLEPARERRYIKNCLIDPVLAARDEQLSRKSYSILQDIETLIAEKRGNITLTECAEMLGVHPTYIWKMLKMERGKSFSDYLEEHKLEEAKRLLLNTSMTVAEIAVELNYTNAQNFIRFFSKSTGVTPGKFRKLY